VIAGGRSSSSRTDDDGTVWRAIDVAQSASVEAALDAATELGPLRVVAGCHGITTSTPLESLSDEDLTATLNINLAGTIRLLRGAATRMRDGGAIVTVSSVGGSRGFASHGVVYGASKAGLESVTRYYAAGLAPRGIRVNTVVPGPLDHTMGGAAGAEVRAGLGDFEAAIKSLIPLGRPVTVAEVADAIAFLASDEASGITGAALPVDGGLLARLRVDPARRGPRDPQRAR
jgi:3-oxoacyl-[acyl-carrier protein] reductase